MSKIRSFFTSGFAFMYLFLSLGIGLEAHYCHGNLSSISVTLTDVSCECDGGEEMSCCSTEEAVMQLDEVLLSQQKVNASKLFLPSTTSIDEFQVYQRPSFSKSQDQHLLFEEQLPPIYLLNSSFLHYG